MAIRDDILTLKNKEGTLTDNKVCNFAYDDTAFEDDTTAGANGVTTYNYNNHNNIPVKDPTVLKTNATIISKGFRSQVSVLPRMLLNHIFGRVSYNLNKTVDTLNSLLSNIYNYIGQPNGLATLDNTGRLPYSQLPLSAVEYKGAWNANTNTPTLASGTGTFGDEYIVSVQGTQNIGEGNITYKVGDRVIYNGSIWQHIPASAVRTVNLKTPDADGNVTINANDIVTPLVYGYDRRNAGKTWEKTSLQNHQNTFNCLHYANGIWVAGDDDYTYVSSNRGKNWLRYDSYGTRCVFFKGLWVKGTPLHGLRWSFDARDWQACSIPEIGAVQSTFNCICANDNIWVAGGGGGSSGNGLWWSEDGKTWTKSNVSGRRFHFVNYDSRFNLWIAGGATGAGMWWSDDGKTWTQGTESHPTMNFYAMNTSHNFYFNNVSFVASDYGIYKSTDGKYWELCTDTSGISFNDVCLSNRVNQSTPPIVLAVGEDGIWKSTNGSSWVQYSGTDNKVFNCIFSIDDLIVAGGEDGLWWSNDTVTFTKGSGTSNSTIFKLILSAEGSWVSAGSVSSAYAPSIVYSEGEETNNVGQILDWLLYAVDNKL